MKTFKEWFKDNFDEELPTGTVSCEWFVERGLPMIVACSCCGMTMALPSALVDDNDTVVCNSCGGDLL